MYAILIDYKGFILIDPRTLILTITYFTIAIHRNRVMKVALVICHDIIGIEAAHRLVTLFYHCHTKGIQLLCMERTLVSLSSDQSIKYQLNNVGNVLVITSLASDIKHNNEIYMM